MPMTDFFSYEGAARALVSHCGDDPLAAWDMASHLCALANNEARYEAVDYWNAVITAIVQAHFPQNAGGPDTRKPIPIWGYVNSNE